MDSFDENCCWEFSDYATFINDFPTTDLEWINPSGLPKFDCSPATGAVSLGKECAEKECSRQRGRNKSCNGFGTKACRERQRRENLNNRFLELSSTLELGRPSPTDKSAIIGDAIRVLNQLKTESQEYKEANERMQEEIRSLKAEKNELRKEKHALKAEKSKMEQQLKTMTVSPTGCMPTHPAAAFPAGPNNMPVFPSYSYVPMWHYLPPSVRDTSHDHELRPPAA